MNEQTKREQTEGFNRALTPSAPAKGSTAPPTEQLETAKAPAPPKTPPSQNRTISSATYFSDMSHFLTNCRVDKRITPHTQLVYRVLVDLANRAYWTFPFEASDSDIKEITHIASKDTLISCKRTLKNLGYIDFYGKPNKYIVYSPPDHGSDHQPDYSEAPHTPHFNTQIHQDKTIKKKTSKKERWGDDELHDSSTLQRSLSKDNGAAPDNGEAEKEATLKERITAKLALLRSRREAD